MSAMTAPFPSIAWFEELVARATADQVALERLGTADFRLGAEVVQPDGDRRLFGLEFDGYDITATGPVDEEAFSPTRCSPAPWKRGAR